MFNILGQIQKELKIYNDDYIKIAGIDNGEDNRYLQGKTKGYFFNQPQTIDLIDLYYNSKFEKGPLDSEGQRKLFLNICAFRSDVASKMVDIDTKDFVFIPDGEESKWGAYFMTKRFKEWSRDTYFGELINEVVENYPKYGTVVIKNCGGKLERVNLKNFVIQPDAKDIECAKFVMELHKDMTIDDMNEYPDWDTEGLNMEFGETVNVYERYGKVPAKFFYDKKKQAMPSGVKEDDTVNSLIITTMKATKQGDTEGQILFIEEVDEKPYMEVHWKKQDGRWLGVGEVENQFENQIARNMIANLRRRALYWSSKKIFQSPDSEIAKNLVRDVKDGDIIKIMPNGNITQVDMASRQIGEFQSAEALWEDNSNQKSFTFEVATGEAMPSGTPVRLGVMLSNAVNSHFGLKKEKLGLFFKKLIMEFQLENFKKDNKKEHTIRMFSSDKGFSDLRKVYSEVTYSKALTDWAMSEETVFDFQGQKAKIEQDAQNKTELFVELPKYIYEDIEHHVELVITGEEIDTNAQIGTLTTIYQMLSQQGDPRAEQLLERITQMTGMNLEATIGEKPKPQPQQIQAQQPQQSTMPNVQPNNQQAIM